MRNIIVQKNVDRGGFWLCVLLLALVHSTSFAAEKWLDEFNVGDIASGYSDSRPNKSISDKPLSVGGVVFKRGAGTHAPSSGSFMTDGKSPLRFTAKVGADDAAGSDASVVFQVFGDDKKLFDSGLMRKGDPAKDVDVDLTGHKRIELRITDGGNGNTFDHANWCDARFVYADSPPQLALRWTLDLPHFSGEAPAAPSKFTALTSPNGKVAAHVGVAGGRLVLAVRRDGKTVLEPSPLGVMVDGVDLGDNVEIGTMETYTTDTTYPDPRGPGSLQDQCKGVKLSLRAKGSTISWTLEVRAYDDGVAWRYLVPGSGTRKVTGEATSFVLPEGAIYWSNLNTVNYEGNFLSFTATGSAASKSVTMPITVELPDGGFACITEANIIGYSGMTIGPRGRILTGIFEDDTKGWNLEGNIATPWRIVIAVDSLDALVNQSIVYNVSPPPDPKLFPKGKDTDWIKPGRAFWTWGFGQYDSAKWEMIQGFVDDAASLNCPYYVIDDPWRDKKMGWHRNGKNEWASLKEFCDYAAKKNVKIMVWEHSSGIRDLAAREEFFRNVSEAGAVGVKIDFMDDESQNMLEFYRSCLEVSARYKIMINFHGAYKPAGEERTWPHWMTREAVLGMEHGGGPRQTFAALPFTRFVTGPADCTPTVFRPDAMGNSTAGSQLAIAVAYSSPLHHWGDSAKTYNAQAPEVLDFIRNKPAVWDETRVLPGSTIGKAALMARRSGDIWHVAAINGTDQDMTHEIKTSFLAAGKWDAVSFSDVPGDKTKLSVNKSSVISASAVNARMTPGGGFVMVIRLSLPAGAEEGVIPAREGTLHVLSFGVGAPMDGPPVDDLYGRDAGFVAEALKRSPSAWTRVETTFVSGLACTPERLSTELVRLGKAASASDFVLIHASTHGTTEEGFLRLDGAKGPPVINANVLAASLAGLPCPSLVTIDACMAGGAVRSPLPPRSAWLLGCSETQSTDGQYDDPKVPHGFLVLALCEALRGDADTDRDGVVTVGELCAWVPKRATYLARFSCFQDGVVVLPADLAALPLTRAVPGEHKPLWTMPRVESRNPWGLPDPPALPQDAKPAAKLIVALKDRPAAAKAWNGFEATARPPEPGKGDSLDGTWVSRRGKDEAKQLENQGRAEIAETKHGFFALVLDESGSYLIEAARDPADPTRLSGRWVSLGSPKESSRWEGRVVDKRRIDGQSFKGVWDFRR